MSLTQCCQLSDFDAMFSYFSDPFGDFFSKQRQATNLAPFSAVIGDFWRLFEVKALSLLPLHNEHRVPARPLPRLKALTGSPVLVQQSLPAALLAGANRRRSRLGIRAANESASRPASRRRLIPPPGYSQGGIMSYFLCLNKIINHCTE